MDEAEVEALIDRLDGIIVSQQLVITWMVENLGADPAALSGLIESYRQKCRTSAGVEATLARMEDYAANLAALKNAG